VWHIPLLWVEYKNRDDGQRNCPKHVEFYSKNKSEKLVHLLCFIIRIYHEARSTEHQIPFLYCNFPMNSDQDTQKYTLLYIYLFIYLLRLKAYKPLHTKINIRPLFTCLYKWVNVSHGCVVPIDTFHPRNIQTCTSLFEMIVGVLTTCHTQYTWDRSIFFYLIEQRIKFLLHTL